MIIEWMHYIWYSTHKSCLKLTFQNKVNTSNVFNEWPSRWRENNLSQHPQRADLNPSVPDAFPPWNISTRVITSQCGSSDYFESWSPYCTCWPPVTVNSTGKNSLQWKMVFNWRGSWRKGKSQINFWKCPKPLPDPLQCFLWLLSTSSLGAWVSYLPPPMAIFLFKGQLLRVYNFVQGVGAFVLGQPVQKDNKHKPPPSFICGKVCWILCWKLDRHEGFFKTPQKKKCISLKS